MSSTGRSAAIFVRKGRRAVWLQSWAVDSAIFCRVSAIAVDCGVWINLSLILLILLFRTCLVRVLAHVAQTLTNN